MFFFPFGDNVMLFRVCFWRICVNVLRFWMVQLKCRMSPISPLFGVFFWQICVDTWFSAHSLLTPRWNSTCEFFLWGFLEALYSKLLDEYGYFWVLLHGNLGMQSISLFHVEDLFKLINFNANLKCNEFATTFRPGWCHGPRSSTVAVRRSRRRPRRSWPCNKAKLGSFSKWRASQNASASCGVCRVKSCFNPSLISIDD